LDSITEAELLSKYLFQSNEKPSVSMSRAVQLSRFCQVRIKDEFGEKQIHSSTIEASRLPEEVLGSFKAASIALLDFKANQPLKIRS
jgi:hypothetical protein